MADRLVPQTYATIQAALAACASGDEVRIATGTYDESNLWPPTAASGVTLGPQDGASVVVAPTTASYAVFSAPGGASAANFTVEDIGVEAPSGKYCFAGATSSGFTVRRCTVPPVHAGTFYTTGGTGGVIEDCVVLGGVQGIRRSGGSRLTVRNTIVRLSAPGGGRVACETYHATDRFYNSLFILGSGVTGQALAMNHAAQARNVIAYKEGASGGTGVYLTAGADVDYCLSYGFSTNFDETWQAKGANCLTSDPDFDAPGSYDYHVPVTSPCVDAGETVASVTDDLDGVARPQRSAYDIGPYEYPAISVLSAEATDARTVVVTFDGEPTGTDLLDTEAWALEATTGATAAPEIESVSADGVEVTLELSGPLVAGGAYLVTAPSTLDSLDLDHDDAAFVYDAEPTPEETEYILEAMTTALGDQADKIAGFPVSRLRLALEPGATTAEVESTLHFDDAGEVLIGGHVYTYTGRTHCQLLGLATEETVLDAADEGAEVRALTFDYGLLGRAWAETVASACPDDFIEVLAGHRGTPRPLAQTTADGLRDYIHALHYKRLQTWHACFLVLRAMFDFAALSGDDAETYETATDGVRRLDIPTASLSGQGAATLHDRWIEVDGRTLRVRSARDDVEPGYVTLQVQATEGPTWESSDHFADATGVSWRLLPFRLLEVDRPGDADGRFAWLRVYLYVAASRLPATYLLTSGLAAPDRLERGKLSLNEGAAGHARGQSFYLARPYARATMTALRDVVAAGVTVEVVSRPVVT